MMVQLGTLPDAWFKNLRLLQVRVKLNLITSLWLSLSNPVSCVSGEIVAKIKALEGIVGKRMVENHKVPTMKKPRIRVKYNLANIAIESSRNRGLLVKDKRYFATNS